MVGEGRQSCCLWSKIRVVVMQQPVLLSPKFGAKSSHGEGSAQVRPMETFGVVREGV
jgi:hypothetical protein